MPSYKYQATDINGKITRGLTAATSTTDLTTRLRDRKLYLVSCAEDVEKHSIIRLKPQQVADFCRELGAMLSSGVSLIRAINIMLMRDMKPKIKAVYQNICDCLQRGLLLSEALDNQNGAFPPLLISMYRAAEASGTLDVTSMKMADYYEKEHRLHKKIKSATAYPKFLTVLTILVVAAIFVFVLPKFLELFEGMELPLMTQIVVGLSTFIAENWLFMLICVLLAILAVSFVTKVPSVRYIIDRAKLRIIIVGKLLKIIYTARFARTISSLYASGLSIVTVLQNSRGTIGNEYIARQFDDVILKVRQGISLSEAMRQVDGFDAKLYATIMIGEETGRLELMLESTADAFDYEADSATSKLTALLEPLLLIVMALIIGFIMIAVMLPILSLYDKIGTGL